MDITTLIPFSDWLLANKISRTTGYRLVRDGALKLTKIRRRSYLTETEIVRFVKSVDRAASDHGCDHAA